MSLLRSVLIPLQVEKTLKCLTEVIFTYPLDDDGIETLCSLECLMVIRVSNICYWVIKIY